MLTIRLTRIGKKNKPMYRLIISEKARDPYGRALEILGSYNPYSKELNVQADRVKYWLSNGAGMSATVNNLLIEKKIIEGKKMKTVKIKKSKREEMNAKKEAPAENAKVEAPAEAPVEKPVEAPAEAPVENATIDKPEEKPVVEVSEPAVKEVEAEKKEETPA